MTPGPGHPHADTADSKRDAWSRFQSSALLRNVSASPLLRHGAMLALWVLVWQLARLVEYTEHASVWFPVAGLTFALLLLGGMRAVPALVGGCVLVTLWIAADYGIALGKLELVCAGLAFAAAHIGSYAIGACCLRAVAARSHGSLPELVVGFLLIAAFSSLLATATGLWALVATKMMPLADVSATWLPYWIGDMAGVIVLAPLFTSLLSSLRPGGMARLAASISLEHQAATPRFKYKLLLTLALLAGSMWLAHATRSPNSAFAIFFLVIPYMWIACTESAFYNLLGVALGSFIIALLVHVLALKEFVMVYQFAINVIAANTLFGLALPSLIADNIKLRRLADTDSLTQAASRDCLEQRALLDIIRCRQQHLPLALIVFDIDHFKSINDRYGHAVGDKALKHVCLMAQQALRPADMLGRFGGDEFVALMPGNDRAAAIAIAERIRVHVNESELEGVHPITASFGIADLHEGDTYESLFARADQALYKAKQEGRNRAAWLAA
ncbi:diguanylate cyclase [Massilia sp. TSP1-1-2]|uniref:GGDEF domain-containing protein n=1 Tax=Massilia sp. TSP1-1-2 TaxID=2804649 RepID=UPI003CF2FE79